MDNETANIVFRKARRKDHQRIKTLHELTFREHVEREPDFNIEAPFLAPFLKRFPVTLKKSKSGYIVRRKKIFVCERDAVFCGYVALDQIDTLFRGGFAMISDISVPPDMRGTGIAHVALDRVTRFCSNRNIPTVQAHVWPKNHGSHALFLEQGFELADDNIQDVFAPMTVYCKQITPSRIAQIRSVFKGAALIVGVMGMALAISLAMQ